MAIEYTIIDDQRVITPKVTTKELIVDGVQINKISTVVADEDDAIPVGSALQPWINEVTLEINDRLDAFEESAVLTYVHPATHSADMITETATRVWLTPELRTKLIGVAANANNYIHPVSHSADMITETATRVWLTPELRTKLGTMADYANNYTHPTSHPPSMITGFLDGDGYVNSSLIRNLSVQRINVRHTTLSGFRYYILPGVIFEDYVDAPFIEPVDLGTNEWAIRITPTELNPLIATIAEGFDATIGNKDAIVTCTTPLTTMSVVSYGFAVGDLVNVMLRKDKTLYLTTTTPELDLQSMVNNPIDAICIAKFIVSTGNGIEKLIPIVPGRYFKWTTEFFDSTFAGMEIFNRLLTTHHTIFQLQRQLEGQTHWTVIDNYITGAGNYNASLRIMDGFNLQLLTPNCVPVGGTRCKIRVIGVRCF